MHTAGTARLSAGARSLDSNAINTDNIMKPQQSNNSNTKSKQSITGSPNTQNNLNKTRTLSTASDVFNSSNEIVDNDFKYATQKQNKTLKRNLSVTDTESKNKPMFTSVNRFSPLAINDEPTSNENNSQEDSEIKIKSPPPIIIRGMLDFIGFRNKLINLIGPENFQFKSSTNDLKVQTTKPEYYRKVIHFLKNQNAQYHTYQPQEEKSFRLVIRNLHPSTPTTEIGVAIEDKGYTVRQVANVLQRETKNKLPIFFIDLEPATINKEIFTLTSLLNTKVKVEEPHKRKDILQCLNCQDYGHTKKILCIHT